jgi:hypothetical protein
LGLGLFLGCLAHVAWLGLGEFAEILSGLVGNRFAKLPITRAMESFPGESGATYAFGAKNCFPM